jgi:hypothetical protein
MSRLNRIRKASVSAASSSGPWHANYHPFGPDMAESIFDARYYDLDGECVSDEIEDSYYPSSKLDDADLFDGELQSYHFRYQGDLELETSEEVEAQLRHRLKKLNRAYNVMCHHALKWHYLMEDVEGNEQIKKMFKDMQLFRKMSGSDNV